MEKDVNIMDIKSLKNEDNLPNEYLILLLSPSFYV